jgi:hypothetical protein
VLTPFSRFAHSGSSFVDKRLFVPAQDGHRVGGQNGSWIGPVAHFWSLHGGNNMRQFTWATVATATAAIALSALGNQPSAVAATAAQKKPAPIVAPHCAAKPGSKCPYTTEWTCAKWYSPLKCCTKWRCTSVIH